MGDLFTDVTIRGDVFEVDILKDEMRYKADPVKVIRFAEMEPLPGTLSLQFLYDQRSKTAFRVPPTMHRLPEDVHLVELFGKAALDPVTYYRERNIHQMLVEPKMYWLRFSKQKVREIPKADVNRHQYFVSAVDRAFIDTINLQNRIPFEQCYSFSKDEVVLFYDPIGRRIANHQDGSPGIYVRLPPVTSLDPDGCNLLRQEHPRPPALMAEPAHAVMYKSKRTGKETWIDRNTPPRKKKTSTGRKKK